jgi:hypothetical protein
METRRLLELVAVTACTSVALANTAPAATAGQPKPGRRPVPVLMHHVIAEPPTSAPFPDLYVSAELQAQVRWLEAAVTPRHANSAPDRTAARSRST